MASVALLISGAVVGFFFARLSDLLDRRRERREAAGALLYEARLNLVWAERVTGDDRLAPYLRDEAHVFMKNRGYVVYLDAGIWPAIVDAYNALHRLNEATSRRREEHDDPAPETYLRLARSYIDRADRLVPLLTKYLPRASRARSLEFSMSDDGA